MIHLEGRENVPLYRLDSPWVLERPGEVSDDTTQPIAFLTLDDLKITIHNFPDIKIPPQAQVQRWIGQLNGKEYLVTPTSHSGFVGLILESEEMLAAAFSLSPYYEARTTSPDWTIKAVGNVQKYRNEILSLINSFELIDPL